MRKLIAPALALALSGCATIVEGTRQNITVDASAPNAICTVSRQGEIIGTSQPGARTVSVEKSQHDLTVSCEAAGYQPRTEVLSSSLSSATVASFFLLDFGVVDAATGAWKKYPERITLIMQPLPVVEQPRRGRSKGR